MKKFLIKISSFIALIGGLLVGINYMVDPAKIFNDDYEKEIASWIIEGNHVTNITNYDERKLEKEIINEIQETPEVLVLGSSRTMLIDQDLFKGKKFRNHSVSGATLEDLIGLYQLYKKKNKLPKKIIIGIDPWAFNVNNGQKRWKSLETEYLSYLGKNVPKLNPFTKWSELVSLSYFQSALKYLPTKIKGKDKAFKTKEIYNQTNTKLKDGSIIYGNKHRNISEEEIEQEVNNYLKGTLYSLGEFKEISPKLWNEFEQFQQDILSNNIELIYFISPYHPKVYKEITEKYTKVIEVENKIKTFAKNKNLKVYGSFDPIKVTVEKNGFYDGMHCKKDVIKRLFQNNSAH